LLIAGGHRVVNATDATGVADLLREIYAKWGADALADMPEEFQFPVDQAVREIVRLVGALDNGR